MRCFAPRPTSHAFGLRRMRRTRRFVEPPGRVMGFCNAQDVSRPLRARHAYHVPEFSCVHSKVMSVETGISMILCAGNPAFWA